MVLTKPYGQKNYMGEYASDALALAFIQASRWDTNGDGTGDPYPAMMYYNTQLDLMKLWDGTSWKPISLGNDFQESVIDFYDPTVSTPPGPAVGDRYISSATANGWINNYIYEWDGAVWMETIPTEGSVVEVEASNDFYAFTGAAWVLLPSLLAHNDLLGLQGGAVGEYYHQNAHIQALYVGKHGNDANDGLTDGSAFLMFGAAVAAAVAGGASIATPYVIRCEDDGAYIEDLTIPSYVNIFAPSAIWQGIVSALSVDSNCSVKFREMNTSPVSPIGISKPDTVGTCYIEAEIINSNGGIGLINLAFVNSGVMMVKAKQVYGRTAGTIIIGDVATSAGHMHLDIGDIYIDADNIIALARVGVGVSTVGRIDHILETAGGHAGSVGISVISGEVDLNISVITLDTAYVVAAAGALQLFVNSITGTQTVAVGGVVHINPRGLDVAALPVAAVGYRGEVRRVLGGAGVRDREYICLKSDSDVYSWVEIVNGGL